MVTRLDDDDAKPCGLKIACCLQAGDTSTNHDDVGAHPVGIRSGPHWGNLEHVTASRCGAFAGRATAPTATTLAAPVRKYRREISTPTAHIGRESARLPTRHCVSVSWDNVSRNSPINGGTPSTGTFLMASIQSIAAPARRVISGGDAPGTVVAFQKVGAFNAQQLTGLRGQMHFPADVLPPVRNGVVLYAVQYRTPDLEGKMTTASGLVIVPDTQTGPMPVVSYQHGTIGASQAGPSTDANSSERLLCAAVFGASGFLCSLPDYLGFGAAGEPHPEKFYDPKLVHIPGANQARIFHPYLDCTTESSASVDMLRAMRTVTKQLGVSLSPKLFLAGYSQGGQSTMATHRYLESTPELRKEFPVTASVPMAGPHDVLGSVQAVFHAFVDRAAAEVAYGTIAADHRKALARKLDDVFAPDVAEQIWKNFSYAPGTTWTDGLLEHDPKSIYRPEYLAKFYRDGKIDPRSELGTRLDANRTDNWATTTPIRLIHGSQDQEVAYAVNGQPVVDAMKARGCTDIALITVAGDHVTAVIPAFAGAAQWFESQRAKPATT